MYFCEVVVFYFFLQVSTLFINVFGQCSWADDPLSSMPNAYRSNSSQLTLYSDNLAYGHYEVKCKPGYIFDPPSSGRIKCQKSGSWSKPLPCCKSTGRCSMTELTTFMDTYGVLNDKTTNFLYTDGLSDTLVLGGSNVTVYCADRYHNVGGSLTIVCTQNNSWTSFPRCALISARCPVTNDAWTFDNGYLSETNGAARYSDNTAEGFVVVSCYPGYTIDSTSNGVFTCNNGTWSARPYCTVTGRCSLPDLHAAIDTTGTNYDSSTDFLYTDGSDSDLALSGSNITVYCSDKYHNVGGSLTVVCTQNNSWTPFPKCTLISARCPITSDTWVFPNGYLSNTDDLEAYDDNTAEGFVEVSCNSGYTIDSTSQGVFKCNNGIWSSPPYCTQTTRCAPSQVDKFVSNTAVSQGVQLASRSSSVVPGETDAVLVGSYVVFTCMNGYSNPIGSLTVTCTTGSGWSVFPSCAAVGN